MKTLSDKSFYCNDPYVWDDRPESKEDIAWIKVKDVKEFIKELREELKKPFKYGGVSKFGIDNIINKLAGDKLI